MVTNIHQVRVSSIEGGGGYLATCEKPGCRFHTIRPLRADADQAATEHQRRQNRPDPADQVNDIPDLREWVS